MLQLRQASESRLRAFQLVYTYLPFNIVAQALFATVLFGMSAGSRHRRALLCLAAYFLLVVLVFDLPFALEVFGDWSPTTRNYTAPITRAMFVLFLEASLGFLRLRLYPAVRIGSYLVFVGLLTFYSQDLSLLPCVALLIVAVRKRDTLSRGFMALLTLYSLLILLVFPPISMPLFFKIGPLGFALVPGYRVLIGVAAILLVIRQSVRDRRERERLAGELAAARAVQQLMISAEVEGVEAVYLPANEVGGDFYQILPLADGSTLVALGDVSGKGLKAAMVASMVIGVIRLHRESSPALLLEQINHALVGAAQGFVTCLIARVRPDRTAVVASAGHPAPYRNGAELLYQPGLPLGIDPNAAWLEVTVDGDSLTLLSDGVLEAADAKGELFGFDRTAAISTNSAREIAEAARVWGQNDDITVVTVRRGA
jgi:hypothetical protein